MSAPAPPLPHAHLSLAGFLNHFAYFGGIKPSEDASDQCPTLLSDLAAMASPENWGAQLCVLKSYLEQTFKRVLQQHRLAYSADFQHACFNTGLYDKHYRFIFMYFVANSRYDPKNTRHKGFVPPFFYKRFYQPYDLRKLGVFQDLPDPVHYFDDPYELLFDRRVALEIKLDHILDDQVQLQRLTDASPTMNAASPSMQRTLLKDAVENAKVKCQCNIRTLVPQFFRDKNNPDGALQLLMPIEIDGRVCVVMPIQKHPKITGTTPPPTDHMQWYYSGSTVLSMGMAFQNARLLFKIESEWLKPM